MNGSRVSDGGKFDELWNRQALAGGMKVRRLFIFSQWLKIDGVSASLLGLLKGLDYSKVKVDLFLQHHAGEWMAEIPHEVNLLPWRRDVARIGTGLDNLWRAKDYVAWLWAQAARYVAGAYYRILRRCKVDEIGFGQIGWELKRWMLPRRIGDGHYDLCLIFGGNPGFARLVDADVKAAWIHTDWSHHKPIRRLARRQFSAVDYVVNVSEGAKAAFDAVVGVASWRTKSIVIENSLSPAWMLKRSAAYEVTPFKGFRLLSVGRVSAPKNFMRAVAAAVILKRSGMCFKWILVGDGEDMASLRSAVERSAIADCLVLAGSMKNPYPFYRWCDAFVCTSDWEGKSVSVREAQSFGKPVVVTKFPTASSQIEDGVDGLLVERTAEAVADGIVRLIENPSLRELLSSNCRSRDYANLGDIDKILSLCR